MSNKLPPYFLVSESVRQSAIRLLLSLPIDADNPFVMQIKAKTRSLDQNAKLWACLTDVSNQVNWHGRKLSPESWKCVFSASLKAQDVVPNIDGTGFVVMAQSTSNMTIKEMVDLIELIHSFGAQNGVVFND